jgi:hypothetical protein
MLISDRPTLSGSSTVEMMSLSVVQELIGDHKGGRVAAPV